MNRGLRPMIASLALVIAVAGGAATVNAQDGAFGPVPFTIHKATCPIDFAGDIYDACHDNVLPGVTFEVRGFEMATDVVTTDSNGVAVAMILENMSVTSDITVIEDAAAWATYQGAYVYCSDQNSGDVLYDGAPNAEGAIYFEALSTGQDVICDWYNFTAAGGSGESGDSGVSPGTTDSIQVLPATGTGPVSPSDGLSFVWMALIVSLLGVGRTLWLRGPGVERR